MLNQAFRLSRAGAISHENGDFLQDGVSPLQGNSPKSPSPSFSTYLRGLGLKEVKGLNSNGLVENELPTARLDP